MRRGKLLALQWPNVDLPLSTRTLGVIHAPPGPAHVFGDAKAEALTRT